MLKDKDECLVYLALCEFQLSESIHLSLSHKLYSQKCPHQEDSHKVSVQLDLITISSVVVVFIHELPLIKHLLDRKGIWTIFQNQKWPIQMNQVYISWRPFWKYYDLWAFGPLSNSVTWELCREWYKSATVFCSITPNSLSSVHGSVTRGQLQHLQLSQ